MGWRGCALRTRYRGFKELEIRKDKVANSLTGVQTDSLVYMPTSSTSTQHKFMKGTLMNKIKKVGNLYKGNPEIGRVYSTEGISPSIKPQGPRGSQYAMSPKVVLTNETSEKLMPQKYQTTTYLPQGFLANLSALLGKEGDLKILEELCSLKLLASPNKSNHAFYSLKTLKGYYHTTKVKHLELSSTRWMNWGMTAGGKCLTAKISVSPRIGNECSLSDILEEQVDQKYFLSEQAIKRMNLKGHSPTLSTQATGEGQTETKNKQPYEQTSRIHKKEGISPTVPTASGGHHIPMICE